MQFVGSIFLFGVRINLCSCVIYMNQGEIELTGFGVEPEYHIS